MTRGPIIVTDVFVNGVQAHPSTWTDDGKGRVTFRKQPKGDVKIVTVARPAEPTPRDPRMTRRDVDRLIEKNQERKLL